MTPEDLNQTRKANLRLLVKEHKGGKQLAGLLGFKDSSYLYQMIGVHRRVTEAKAREIEKSLGLPPGWLDQETHPSARALAGQVQQAANDPVMHECIAVMKTTLDKLGVRVKSDRFADLCMLFHQHSVQSQGVDRDYAKKLVSTLTR